MYGNGATIGMKPIHQVASLILEVWGEGACRVFRGGSWNNRAENCRIAYSGNDLSSFANGSLGFRVCCGVSLT